MGGIAVRRGDSYCSGADESVRGGEEDTGAGNGRWKENREGMLGV